VSYIIIEDFRGGLDRRKMAAASAQGTLQACTNAHVTRGGEVEKRKAFVAQYALPPGQTYGLEGAAGTLYTFGSDASPDVPDGVTYQRLEHGDGHAMNALVASEFFDGQVFAVARYVNGNSLQFYDGTEVPDFAASSGANVEGVVFSSLLTYGAKMYGTGGSVLYFSNIDNPANWTHATPPDVGAGFKNMANQSAGSETLTALGKYQNLMAIFARRNTQIWFLDEDENNNARRQVLSNIGTYAPKSVVSFGDIDVFFLADTGVRSLRAPSNSDRAGVTDVGTPIDDELEAFLAGLSEAQKAAAAAAIEPRSGRYIVSIASRCYVFSHYPDVQIAAWSRYDPGFPITDFVSDDGKLWARAGDTVYLYGGATGDEYDSSPVEVIVPFIDGRQIATFKHFTGIDIVCEGTWAVYGSTDPNQPDEESLFGLISGTSIARPAIAISGHSPVIKLRLVNEDTGPAKLSQVIVHYKAAESG
jgi:hypothetical protein